MNSRNSLVALACACIASSISTGAVAAEAPHRHSLDEYAYLIGSWKCIASVPGSKSSSYQTSIRWMYPNHTAIDQTIITDKVNADFILTYDKGSDTFKGIFVDDGSVGVWENPGPVANTWTEFGYEFMGDNLVLSTRATFTGVTPKHYAFRYWKIRNKQDPGELIEADDCTKL